MKAFITALTIIMTACVLTGCGTEYNVPITGDDNNNATSKPAKTILTAEQLREDFLDWKFGMFIHFNVATYNEREWATGHDDPATFAPNKLDCNQWADVAAAAGMKYAVLTVKHTGGWCLWDSEHTSSHDITAFKNYKNGKGDIVREFVDACRKRGIKVGLYYCFPGNYARKNLPKDTEDLHGLPPEAKGDYAGFIKKQLSELLTGYGPIDLLWADQYSNSYTRDDWLEIKQRIKSLQPNCIVIANNSLNFRDTDIHSYEYPWLKNRRPEKALPPVGNENPAEVCDKIGPGWFWSTTENDTNVKSAEEVVDMLKLCNSRRANYLLNVVPDRSGLIPAYSVERLRQVGKLLAEKNQTGCATESDTSIDAANGFVWKSVIPEDCPFERSKTLTGIFFTGRHSDYRCGDTFYPCWASDGNLYSPWTDGKTDGIVSVSGRGENAHTGHAMMIGDDPLKLVIKNTSPPKKASAKPYSGRYPAGSLVYNGIWYYGTYCLGPKGSTRHKEFTWNWPYLGPMPGFQISRDLGKTWEPSPLSPGTPLFPEPKEYLGPVKMGAPHFVDFGQNMKHSPDGKAYLLGMGAVENDLKPRPCIKPAAGGGVEIQDCDEDFDHANLSWVTADQVYLARVKPRPETINDLKAYEFFAGRDKKGQPLWSNDFKKIKPLIEWNNHMGCVTATYVPGLKKYLMCITDGWPTVSKMMSYILEADKITGPWRMAVYMKDFGEQAYFLNFPSKFISEDGKTLWLCYSANFSPGWNDVKLEFNPPGGRYGLCLHEVRLLGSDDN